MDNTPIVPNQAGVVQPYFDIANEYGFANYAFQTNQGPSFQAHQFLFSGTSAPAAFISPPVECDGPDGDFPCYQWFSSELVEFKNGYFGCPAWGQNLGDTAEVDPKGNDAFHIYNNGYPCYSHNTMADLLDNNQINGNTITWKYYPQGPYPGSSLWTAPNAISAICTPLAQDNQGNYYCDNQPYWGNHVDVPQPGKGAPILTDITNCQLPNVSWVIPDGSWSDHAGTSDGSTPPGTYGPSWVAAIVNAVGNNYGHAQCYDGNLTYWQDTVIIVVWDDWGGWYDHVLPWNCAPGPNGACSGYSNGLGGSYVYGFRVPMLVISAYNKHTTAQGYNGYISGACGQPTPTCPNEAPGLVHDFGSILNFIEYAFGTGGNFLSLPGAQNQNKGISPAYPYADWLAPDVYLNGSCPQLTCPYSLSDFFMGSWANPTTFTTIQAPFPPSTFEYWIEDGNIATDPDADDWESSQ